MTDPLQARITAVLREHELTDTPTWANERICTCGATVRTMMPPPSHAEHVAAVLTETLGLTPERGWTRCSDPQCGDSTWDHDCDDKPQTRWVTPWERDK